MWAFFSPESRIWFFPSWVWAERVTYFQRIKYRKSKRLYNGDTWQTLIPWKPTSIAICHWYHVISEKLKWKDHLNYVLVFTKTLNPNLSIRKLSNKSKFRDTLHHTWQLPFKSDKNSKNKDIWTQSHTKKNKSFFWQHPL